MRRELCREATGFLITSLFHDNLICTFS